MILVSGEIPSPDFPSCVIDLTQVYIVSEQGAVGDLPPFITCDVIHRAIAVLKKELTEQSWPSMWQALPDVTGSPHFQGQGIVPAVPQGDSQAVHFFLQEFRHIIYRVINLFTIVGPGRVQTCIPYSHAIH